MSSYVVLTAIGPDRLGLVDEISDFIAKRTINIEDSRMAVLGGEFAVIMLISGSETVFDKISNEIAELEISTGLKVNIKRTVAPESRKVGPSLLHNITATSMDHPGIVHEITSVLKKYRINIESLDTHVANAPLSGSPIFNMSGVISIPADVKISKLRKELDDLADNLNIDIDLDAVR